MGQAWGQRNDGVDGLEGAKEEGERRESWAHVKEYQQETKPQIGGCHFGTKLGDHVKHPHCHHGQDARWKSPIHGQRDLSARVAMIEASQRQVGSVQGEQVSCVGLIGLLDWELITAATGIRRHFEVGFQQERAPKRSVGERSQDWAPGICQGTPEKKRCTASNFRPRSGAGFRATVHVVDPSAKQLSVHRICTDTESSTDDFIAPTRVLGRFVFDVNKSAPVTHVRAVDSHDERLERVRHQVRRDEGPESNRRFSGFGKSRSRDPKATNVPG